MKIRYGNTFISAINQDSESFSGPVLTKRFSVSAEFENETILEVVLKLILIKLILILKMSHK